MISTQTFINRRTVLKEKISSGLILLLGNEEASMNFPENVYGFRQDSTFLYYCGIKEAGLAALIDADSGEDILFGRELTIDDVIWGGPQPSLKDKADSAGMSGCEDISKMKRLLEKALSSGRKIHLLPTYRAQHVLKYQSWGIQHPDEHKSDELIRAVINQRNIKTAEEIEELHHASNITGKMHLAAMHNAKPGMMEYELSGKLHGIALAGGGDISFPIILSVNGHILHNHYHGNKMDEGRLLLVDCGAETASGYAGDKTSTLPVGKTFSGKQKAIYQIVLDSYNAALEMIKPSVPYKDVHLKSVSVIAEGLKAEGVLKGNVEDIVKHGSHALFMPHGLGHMMGMDVHDMENLGENLVGYDEEISRSQQFGLRSLRLGRRLQEGFVLTVEPGIYFIPELIAQWKKEGAHNDFINFDKLNEFMDFGGVRIEDDYLVSAKGYELLGDPLPRTINEVEEARLKAFE